MCSKYEAEIGKLKYVPKVSWLPHHNLDKTAMKICPRGIYPPLRPITVTANGDCLPNAGSLFVYGDETHAEEIRARIIIELVLHKQLYLDPNHLRSLTNTDREANMLPTMFAIFSDYYIPGRKLTQAKIEKIFETEVQEIARPGTFMGIWQLFGLASVQLMKVQSVYPNKGNPTVRKHLHRVLSPRIDEFPSQVATVMWTTTCEDIPDEYWSPNHFVLMLRDEKDSDAHVETDAHEQEKNPESHMEVEALAHDKDADSHVETDTHEQEKDPRLVYSENCLEGILERGVVYAHYEIQRCHEHSCLPVASAGTQCV